MHADPGRRWTLAGLARLANLSRTAFFQRFQTRLGQTPAEYLQDWRLRIAARRLRGSEDSIGAIAAAAGYESPSAFARAFRRATGQSPKSFRAAREPA
jgi:AraC-like DNA-binding protein